MKFDCEIIQDLLPLYIDDVCSMKSKIAVKKHISECPECKELLRELGNQALAQELSIEKNRVIERHLKKEKKRSTMIGLMTAAVLMIPLIICLVCNLAVGHKLDWFFIVLMAHMVFASITVVPLLVNEKRKLWMFCSFTISLVALLGTICFYSGGRWLNIVVPITSYCLLTPWVVVLILRYMPMRKMFRASIASMVSTMLLAFVNDVIYWTTGEFNGVSLADADLTNWNSRTSVGNVGWCIIAAGVILTLVFAILGCVKISKKEVK